MPKNNHAFSPDAAQPKLTGYPPVLRVTTKDELAKALRERTAPIVIGDTKLARPFERLLWAQELRWWFLPTLVAAVLTYAISKEYGLKFDWRAGRYGAGGVILTPPPKPAEDW
jgi:hypothetical protein